MIKVMIEIEYFTGIAEITFQRYTVDNSLCINLSDGEGPILKATVCIHPPLPYGFVYLKGWNENEGLPEALEKAGIVKRTGRVRPTGYCFAQIAEVLVDYGRELG